MVKDGTPLKFIKSHYLKHDIMKSIFAVLILTASVYGSTYAQNRDNCKIVPKHKGQVTTEQKTTLNSCKLVPKQVCNITADRRHVVCHKTYDGKDFTPAGNAVTYYGPDGPVPGQKPNFETETVIIKNENKKDFCIRNDENRTTTCYYSGNRICRDAQGFYYNCHIPKRVPYGPQPYEAVILTGTSSVVYK
jgi:hypothetical protein